MQKKRDTSISDDYIYCAVGVYLHVPPILIIYQARCHFPHPTRRGCRRTGSGQVRSVQFSSAGGNNNKSGGPFLAKWLVCTANFLVQSLWNEQLKGTDENRVDMRLVYLSARIHTKDLSAIVSNRQDKTKQDKTLCPPTSDTV